MKYKIIDITLSKEFEFGWFEDAEKFFKDYRYEHPESEIVFKSNKKVLAKYFPD
jgi:hypothetical protein